jgi:hypothetical protein
MRPIRNRRDGKIARFIEGAHSVYAKKDQWWRETINWYVIAIENLTVESSCMIFSMLFERVSRGLLQDIKFERQISVAIDTITANEDSDAFKQFFNGISSAFQISIPEWKDEQTKALFWIVKEWNAAPSYIKKIDIAHEKLNLISPSPKMLKKRNDLMHRGGLDMPSEKVLPFLYELHKAILALMLKALQYKETFYCLGYGDVEMSEMVRADSADAKA